MERLKLLVLAIALLSASYVPVVGQIDTPPVPPDRDSGELYQRVAASRFVVLGEVSQCQGVGERMTPELTARMIKEGDLSLARSGTLCTIAVESTLCDRAYIEGGVPEASPKPGDSLYIFVPRDDPYFANGHLRETLTPQRRYMLFLVEPPRETADLWLKTYSLDPTRTYYRSEHRSRGIIPLPTGTEGAKLPTVAKQVTQLCEALRVPTLQGKLDALKQLATSGDPVVKEQAEIAQKKLQEALPSAVPLTTDAKPAADHARPSSVQLQQDISELESLRQLGDLDALERVIDRNSVKWRHTDHKQFLEYMLQACNTFSYDIGNLSKRALLQNRYALSALDEQGLTLEENVQLVEFLTMDPPVMDEKAWPRLREQKARLFLTAWRRVADNIDPAFNFDDRPALNVEPPLESGMPAGVAPDAIKDTKLRAQYERSIAENTAKILRINEQYYLKKNAPRFFAEAERYLISAYSRSPADLPELERLLTRYLDDPAVRKRILDEVCKASDGSNSNAGPVPKS